MDNDPKYITDSSAAEDTGYASDQEDETRPGVKESFESYLNGVCFDSDDEEDDKSTTSMEMMPPPTTHRPYSSSCSSLDGSESPPSGEGYVSGESEGSSSSPFSTGISDISSESDEDAWEMKYLQKKRELLTRACSVLKRDEMYDASVAGQLATSEPQEDSALWVEAKNVLKELGMDAKHKRKGHAHMPKRFGKRPRIDMTSVSHVTTHEDDMKDVCPQTGHEEKPAVPRVTVAREVNEETMDLEHAIAFTPVAQLLTEASPPFMVIHANRAFSEFSGLATERLIGHRSLGTIITKTNTIQDQQRPKESNNEFVDACLKGRDGDQACRMRTISVRDARRRNSNEEPPVTHLLVQIKPFEELTTVIGLPKSETVVGSSHLVGAVG